VLTILKKVSTNIYHHTAHAMPLLPQPLCHIILNPAENLKMYLLSKKKMEENKSGLGLCCENK
jgi:hypothetical protein